MEKIINEIEKLVLEKGCVSIVNNMTLTIGFHFKGYTGNTYHQTVWLMYSLRNKQLEIDGDTDYSVYKLRYLRAIKKELERLEEPTSCDCKEYFKKLLKGEKNEK